MKRQIFVYFFATLYFSGSLFAQTNNAVIINQGDGLPDVVMPSGEIFINGISSKEDIGGVEMSVGKSRGPYSSDLYFTNYNDFPVSVVFTLKATVDGEDRQETGSIVLQPKESKFSRNTYIRPHDFRTITRRLNIGQSQPEGTVENDPTASRFDASGVLTMYGGYFYSYPQLVLSTVEEIKSFLSKLNSKKAYGKNTWRLATPAEAHMVYRDHSLNLLGTTKNLTNSRPEDSFEFVIVCE